MFSSLRTMLILAALFSGGLPAVAAQAVWLAWDPNPESNVVGYNLYRSTTSGGPYAKMNDLPLLTPEYLDEDAVSGATYFYVVTAVNSFDLESEFSSELKVTVGLAGVAGESLLVDAGPDLQVQGGQMVVLAGNASVVPASSLSYRWVQVAGQTVELIGADQPEVTFTAPEVVQPEVLEFELEVETPSGTAARDRVTVVVGG